MGHRHPVHPDHEGLGTQAVCDEAGVSPVAPLEIAAEQDALARPDALVGPEEHMSEDP
jgi:hypothetical protein